MLNLNRRQIQYCTIFTSEALYGLFLKYKVFEPKPKPKHLKISSILH